MFQKATREQARLRVAIDGPAKSGKTFTALVLAEEVVKRMGGRIAVIDTERGSASKYADRFDFDVAELPDFHPQKFMDAVKAAGANGDYSVLVIDSLSHEWMGEGGILQMVETQQAKGGNQFAAWRVPSGLHSKLIDTMLQAPVHLVCTMRSKMEYVQAEERGKTVIKKVGLKPVQREGMEYEFDVLISIDAEHQAIVGGSRCPAMDGKTANCPDGTFFSILLDWVSEGAEPQPRPVAPEAIQPSPASKQLPTESVSDAKAQWNGFLAEYNITSAEALVALGFPTVGAWIKANPGKHLSDALVEIVAVMGLDEAGPFAGEQIPPPTDEL